MVIRTDVVGGVQMGMHDEDRISPGRNSNLQYLTVMSKESTR